MTRITVYNSFVLFWHHAKKSAVKPVPVSKYEIAENDRNYKINDKETYTPGI